VTLLFFEFVLYPHKKTVYLNVTYPYARVDGQWNYICVLIDLFSREIIG